MLLTEQQIEAARNEMAAQLKKRNNYVLKRTEFELKEQEILIVITYYYNADENYQCAKYESVDGSGRDVVVDNIGRLNLYE